MKRGDEDKVGAGKHHSHRGGEVKFGEKVRKKGVVRVLLAGNKRVRAGPSTPVPPWRLEEEEEQKGCGVAQDSKSNTHKGEGEGEVEVENSLLLLRFAHPLNPPPHSVSARKLAAALWEYQHYFPLSAKMRRGVNGHPPPQPHPRLRHLHKDKDLVDLRESYFPDPSPSSPDHQPASASSLRRHVATSLMQHHRSIERNNRALQPVSPASYGSSMEMTPYNPAITPTSSLDFKGRIGESSFSLKTSTELLKVLNRIWSLEEQHASSISLIKALKMELDHARAKIKELVRDRQADREEVDDLMKQITEDKLVRKSKEQDRISAAVQSVRDELEDERKLRKRSESLHRKLARELSELKSSFSSALKEIERERKSRELLEDLSDEFAKGIKDYEQEVHVLRQKSDKDWANRADHDGLILHISDSWLDERMQMKLREPQSGFAEKNSIVDKLRSEIETLLQAKRMCTSKSSDNLLARDSKDRWLRRRSMESVPLNEVVSAPQDVGDEDSVGSGSQCFELNKPINGNLKLYEDEDVEFPIEEAVKSNNLKHKLVSHERIKARNPTNLQVKFEEQMALAISRNGHKTRAVGIEQEEKVEEGNPVELSVSRKSEICEATEEGSSYERKNKHDDGAHGSNSNHMINNLLRSQYLSSEGRNTHPEVDFEEASYGYSGWRSRASPVRQWMSKLTSTDLDVSESSTKLPPGLKENTLKAKLLEARSKGQHRSRLKASKSSS